MLHSTLKAVRSLVNYFKNRKPLRNSLEKFMASAEKRAAEEVDENGSESKKPKVDEDKLLKRKVALLMMYSGVGYMGMQRNPGFQTIEEDLLSALLKAGCIPQEHFDTPQKMQFQRAARTDKGVSAAGQLVSLKMWINVPDLLDKINSHLPEQIRAVDMIRTTNSFNSKNNCSHRTYSYLIPTYAFTPLEELTLQSYRVPDGVIDRVNHILKLYVGTHNFHNFTSGKKADDASAKRYIMSFQCSQPFVREDIEFSIITVKGQSFMLHQIRKMIGLMIAIIRGHTSEDAVQKAFKYEKFDVPKAPGLGLMLEYVHYDRYNLKFGDDGVHQKIDWEPYMNRIEEFKQKHIYTAMIEEEKKEKVMLMWMPTLLCHKFDSLTEEESSGRGLPRTDVAKAKQLVWKVVKAKTLDGSTETSTSTDGQTSSDKASSGTQGQGDGKSVQESKVDSVAGSAAT